MRRGLSDLGQIGERLLLEFVVELRPHGHLENRIGAFAAGPVLPHAVHAGLALEMLLVAESRSAC